MGFDYNQHYRLYLACKSGNCERVAEALYVPDTTITVPAGTRLMTKYVQLFEQYRNSIMVGCGGVVVVGVIGMSIGVAIGYYLRLIIGYG